MEDFRKQRQRLRKEIEANSKLEQENLQAFSSNEEKIHRQVSVCVCRGGVYSSNCAAA
jgi:hypothetical protein